MSLLISEYQWFMNVLEKHAFYDGTTYEVTFLTHVFAFPFLFSHDYNGKWQVDGDYLVKQ